MPANDKPLVQRGHVLLVARQAVERLGHDHIEPAPLGVS